MKKNPSLIAFLVVFVLTVILYLIFRIYIQNPELIYLDNPTEESFEIKINNKSFSLLKGQRIPIKLKQGTHRIKVQSNQMDVDTTFHIESTYGVINPSRSEYIIFDRPYGVGQNKDSVFVHRPNEIDDKIYYGSLKRSKDFWIYDYELGLGKNYPKFVKGTQKQKSSIKKIFRKNDFKQFYFELYE